MENNNFLPNLMTFFKHKVVEIKEVEYERGKRLTLTIENPKYRKKYYLYTWEDKEAYKEVLQADLKPGDVISVHAVLSDYQDSKGVYRMAWEIAKANPDFGYFGTVSKEAAPVEDAPKKSSIEISRDALLAKLL